MDGSVNHDDDYPPFTITPVHSSPFLDRSNIGSAAKASRVGYHRMDATDSEHAAPGHGLMDLHLSDVHIGCCPPGTGFWTTSIRLYLSSPAENATCSAVQTDEDGDLCLERRRTWTIRHLRETTLDAVGGQVSTTDVVSHRS